MSSLSDGEKLHSGLVLYLGNIYNVGQSVSAGNKGIGCPPMPCDGGV